MKFQSDNYPTRYRNVDQANLKERISSKITPLTNYEKFISIELRSKLETVPCQIAIDHSLISQQVKNQRLARYTYALL